LTKGDRRGVTTKPSRGQMGRGEQGGDRGRRTGADDASRKGRLQANSEDIHYRPHWVATQGGRGRGKGDTCWGWKKTLQNQTRSESLKDKFLLGKKLNYAEKLLLGGGMEGRSVAGSSQNTRANNLPQAQEDLCGEARKLGSRTVKYKKGAQGQGKNVKGAKKKEEPPEKKGVRFVTTWRKSQKEGMRQNPSEQKGSGQEQ